MADDGDEDAPQFDEKFVEDADLDIPEDTAARAARQSLEQEERDLMAEWVAGHERAGNELVRRYLKPITRFFQAKVRDGANAEQLVSDFLEELTKAPKKVKTTAKAYVYGVAKFTLFRFFRQRSRNREDLMDATLLSLDEQESPFIANQRVETRLLLRALRRLSLRRAMAVEMHWLEGMSGREIAEILEEPEGTVRNLLKFGLIDLQRQLLALERDPQVLRASQGTYTWLAGLVRYIEAVRAKAAKPPSKT